MSAEGAILVRDIMSRAVKTVRPSSTVKEAVEKMNKFGIGSVVVVDGDRPLGIITERDILRRVVEGGLEPSIAKAKDVMSAPLISISEDATAEEAARLMGERGIKKLPVINEGRLVGIVTSTDLVRHTPELCSLIRPSPKPDRAPG
jgi:CBS domain-containing protein